MQDDVTGVSSVVEELHWTRRSCLLEILHFAEFSYKFRIFGDFYSPAIANRMTFRSMVCKMEILSLDRDHFFFFFFFEALYCKEIFALR